MLSQCIKHNPHASLQTNTAEKTFTSLPEWEEVKEIYQPQAHNRNFLQKCSETWKIANNLASIVEGKEYHRMPKYAETFTH